MSHDESLKAAHLDLSPVDWEFRQRALADLEYRRQVNFPAFAKPSKVFSYRLQPWPTFIERRKIEEMKALSIGVSQLVRSVLKRVFEDDPEAISQFYGIPDPAITRLLMSEPGIDQAISRGDFVVTEDGYKCIEFNLVANLGGWETALMAEMHQKTSLTSSFIKERQLAVSYADTLDILFKHILGDSRGLFPDQSQPLNIVLCVDVNEPLESLGPLSSVFAAAYRKTCEETGAATKGLLFPCKPGQLSIEKNGELKLGGLRVHVVVALYKSTTPIVPAILQSAVARKIKLYNSPICSFLGDKRNLAMFSMLAQTDLVDADERRLIEKVIPWTRTPDVPPILQKVFGALSVDELVARREDLVLKSATSFGGKDVYIGCFTSPQDWTPLVEKALASPGWVIQEYLQSVPLLYQNGEENCSPHNVIWGPFVFGQTYGGMILRMQPQADRTPVNLSLTATEGMIFEID